MDENSWVSIEEIGRNLGLIKGSRQHVHLSDNKLTTRNVGSPYGRY